MWIFSKHLSWSESGAYAKARIHPGWNTSPFQGTVHPSAHSSACFLQSEETREPVWKPTQTLEEHPHSTKTATQAQDRTQELWGSTLPPNVDIMYLYKRFKELDLIRYILCRSYDAQTNVVHNSCFGNKRQIVKLSENGSRKRKRDRAKEVHYMHISRWKICTKGTKCVCWKVPAHQHRMVPHSLVPFFWKCTLQIFP